MRIMGLNISTAPRALDAGSRGASTGKPKNLAMRTMEAVRAIGGVIRDGISFQGNRDVYSVYGYPTRVTYFDCLAKYRRQDVAKRIVDMPADALWTLPPEFRGDDKLVAAMSDLEERLSLWQVLARADRLAAMDDYCAILVGVNDGLSLDQPTNPNRTNQIIFLQPYAATTLRIQEFEANAMNPRFGKPLYYTLNPTTARTNGPQNSDSIFSNLTPNVARIHYSRIIHVADGLLEDEIFGTPRLRTVFNLLNDLLKVGGGSAEMYWLNSRGGMHIDVDKDMDLQSADADDLADEIDDYVNNARRVIRTRGVKVTPINMTNADPRMPFHVTTNLLSGATGIPQRMLYGSEAGALASEQDRANWSVSVQQRRNSFAEPHVFRPLFNVLAMLGMIDLKTALKCEILWPEAFQLSPLERAQTSAQQARSAANLVKAIGKAAIPGTPDVTDPTTGVVTPGQAEVPGIPALVSIEEARNIIMLGYNAPVDPSAPAPEVAIG